jgi:hypothetical protein
MILQGTIYQGGETAGFSSVYYSTQDGVYIEGGERAESDVDGVYSIDLGRYESTTRDGLIYDGYVTFSSVGDKKTYSIESLSCDYGYDPVSLPDASRICKQDIDLDATFLEDFTAIYIPSFWEKYKYYFIGAGLFLALFIGYKIIKK